MAAHGMAAPAAADSLGDLARELARDLLGLYGGLPWWAAPLFWVALVIVVSSTVSLVILVLRWKDLMVTFFDESHARSVGLSTGFLKLLFFTLLSACTVAALQTVGACLVIAMVVTPGATAYLLTDRFDRLILVSVATGALTSFVGAYLSYFLDGATGGVIVTLQTLVFLTAFYLAPRHGVLAERRRRLAGAGAAA